MHGETLKAAAAFAVIFTGIGLRFCSAVVTHSTTAAYGASNGAARVQKRSPGKSGTLSSCFGCRAEMISELSCPTTSVTRRISEGRCCPLCRAEGYYKRSITEGAQVFRNRAATQIQAALRGFLARRRCRTLRLKRPPPSNRHLKARWFAEGIQVRNPPRPVLAAACHPGHLDTGRDLGWGLLHGVFVGMAQVLYS